jgi:hypothetical protein
LACAAVAIGAYRNEQKFFGSFFQKRTASFLACLLESTTMQLRSFVLIGLVFLAGCGGDETPPPEVYAPLTYGYLRTLHLNVATVDVLDHSAPVSPQDVTAQDPVQPGQVLANMARDRIFPAGTSGRAVFVVDAASITRNDDNVLTGQMAAHIDVLDATGARVGYAEARVSRQHVPGSDPENMQNNLYDMTRQMMDDMNVELEFQIRRTLGRFLVANTAVPAPVTAEPLAPVAPVTPPPGGTPDMAPGMSPDMEPGMTSPDASAPPAGMAPPTQYPEDGSAPPVQMSPPPGFLQPPAGAPP